MSQNPYGLEFLTKDQIKRVGHEVKQLPRGSQGRAQVRGWWRSGAAVLGALLGLFIGQ
jgi:hypothetical protein